MRINLKEQYSDYVAQKAAFPESVWRPWQKEPRPEWHGKECDVLAHGVIRFAEDSPTEYHLINPSYLEP